MKTVLAWMAVVWAAALPLAAFAAARSSTDRFASDVFALAVYQIGGTVCHQRPERSFRVASVPMAVCARCTGLYAGAAAAAVIAMAARRKHAAAVRRGQEARQTASAISIAPISAPTARLVLMIAAAPALITWLYEWTSGQSPSNELRALTGVLLGASVGWVLLQVE